MGEAPDGRVLVVVPLFNGAQFLDQTLQSVIAQSHTAFDVVIVDDGSQDDGVEKALRWADRDARISVHVKEPTGIASTRNYALAAAVPGAPYVVFLDQDDVLPPDFFSRATALLRARPDAVGAAALVDLIDPVGTPFDHGSFAAEMLGAADRPHSSVDVVSGQGVCFEELFLHNRLCPPSCVVLRLDVVVSVGGADPSYVVADDWDLMLRVLRHGPVLFLSGARVGYRRHDSNASLAAGDRNILETRRVWARTYFSAENSDEQRRALRRQWRLRQRASARTKSREAMAALSHGAVLRGVRTLSDALAHAMAPRPLKRWGRPASLSVSQGSGG